MSFEESDTKLCINSLSSLLVLMFSKTIPLEEMWKVIEAYGFRREMIEKAHPTNRELLKLYQLIKKNKKIKKDIETVKRLKDYVERLMNNSKP